MVSVCAIFFYFLAQHFYLNGVHNQMVLESDSLLTVNLCTVSASD